jgi:hypothetical protein
MSRFESIGVVGAGMMGSEIALMFALSGRPTLLSDQSRDAAERAIERLHGVLDRGLPCGFWSVQAAETARRHLSVSETLEGYADRDFVIGAVFEDEAIKRDVFKARRYSFGGRRSCLQYLIHLDHHAQRRCDPDAPEAFHRCAFSFHLCRVCDLSKLSRPRTAIAALSTPFSRR